MSEDDLVTIQESDFLGMGSFGVVFKGVQPTGDKVAVKMPRDLYKPRKKRVGDHLIRGARVLQALHADRTGHENVMR